MKKIVILLAIIFIAVSTTDSFGQRRGRSTKTLKNGFGLNFQLGFPSSNYGSTSDLTVIDEAPFGLLGGLELGSRWYFMRNKPIGIGLLVNWIDVTATFKSTTSEFYDITRAVVDFSLIKLGPIATFALSDDIAIDAYYNLKPTELMAFSSFTFNGTVTDPSVDISSEKAFYGFGFTHALGAAFRWKIVNVGFEYVLGKVKCADAEDEVADQKLVVDNFRVKLGLKF